MIKKDMAPFLPFYGEKHKSISDKIWKPGLDPPVVKDHSDSWFNVEKKDYGVQVRLKAHIETEDTIKARKVRLIPTPAQRETLIRWFGIYRWFYNKTIDHIEFTREIDPHYWVNKHEVRKDMYPYIVPPWFVGEIPSRIIDGAIYTCCENYIRNFEALKAGRISHFNIRYKTKKDLQQNIFLSRDVFSKTKNAFCVTRLGMMKSSIPFKDMVRRDCRLIYHPILETFDLVIPTSELKGEIQAPMKQTIALDPGNRSFLTGYSQWNHTLDIGRGALKTIHRTQKRQDNLKSKMKKCKNKKRIKSYRVALHRISKRIEGLRNDLHWKSISYLTKNYDKIAIGDLSTSKCVQGKIGSKTRRGLYTLSHFLFRQRLQFKCRERGVIFHLVDESYTSKTCSLCGEVNGIKSLKKWTCKRCSVTHDRDVNGARNIYIKMQINA